MASSKEGSPDLFAPIDKARKRLHPRIAVVTSPLRSLTDSVILVMSGSGRSKATISAHMKAAVYAKAKAGKVLEIKDLEQPVPKNNEVVIRVRAASINPLDWRMKSHRPGVDVAGQVAAVGGAVTQFKVGDAVFGLCKGAFAEYACALEAKLVRKPESLSFDQAAAVPVAGLTALQGLRDKGHLQPGQKVLINGAAGGIGTFAVQIAKSFGANVTGVCSTKNVELVRSLGADRIIDYTRDDFTQDSERYDLLLDNVGNRTLSAMRCNTFRKRILPSSMPPARLWSCKPTREREPTNHNSPGSTGMANRSAWSGRRS